MQDFTDEKIQCGRCNGPCHCGIDEPITHMADMPRLYVAICGRDREKLIREKLASGWQWVTCPECLKKSPTPPPAQPLFEQRAGRSLAEVTATFGERGAQYGDTWRNCQWLVLKASLRELGHNIPDGHLRAIASAAFVDMKYQRYEGGYKRDHGIDGVAYGLFHTDEMRELKEGNPS